MKKYQFPKNKLLKIIEQELNQELSEVSDHETQKIPSLARPEPEPYTPTPTEKETVLDRQVAEMIYKLNDRVEDLESRLDKLYNWLQSKAFAKSRGQGE